MRYLVVISKRHLKIIIPLFIIVAIIIGAILFNGYAASVFYSGNEEIESILQEYFDQRCTALISGDTGLIKNQFDLSSRYGKWSYEHEVKRIKYVKDWSAARGTVFEKCETKLKIFSIKGGGSTYKVYLSDRTRMAYTYMKQEDGPINEFAMGTSHSMTLVNKDGTWKVTADWYSDPLEDTMPDRLPSSAATITEIETTETVSGTWLKYNRAKAVEYADKYCGANFDLETGYRYNKKYKSFASQGGDCANFASQVLSDKEAGGIRMGGCCLYKNGEVSASWVNAGAFTRHLLYSGKGKLVSRGKYQKVVSSTKYISPGDIIAYEKKGDIVHVSVVTAIDSNGVPMVNSHTNDRYHVPWDLGWNSSNITFWLVKING